MFLQIWNQNWTYLGWLIRCTDGVCWWKKLEAKKSRDTVPLKWIVDCKGTFTFILTKVCTKLEEKAVFLRPRLELKTELNWSCRGTFYWWNPHDPNVRLQCSKEKVNCSKLCIHCSRVSLLCSKMSIYRSRVSLSCSSVRHNCSGRSLLCFRMSLH